MSHVYFQIFPKSMKWVYKILNRVKPRYYISDVFITYGDVKCRYSLMTLLLHQDFMEDLYKGIPITRLEIVNKF